MPTYTFDQIAVSTTPLRILDEVGVPAARALRLTPQTIPVRYRFDGGLPTETVGHLVAASTPLDLRGTEAIHNLWVLSSTGAVTTIRVTVETF